MSILSYSKYHCCILQLWRTRRLFQPTHRNKIHWKATNKRMDSVPLARKIYVVKQVSRREASCAEMLNSRTRIDTWSSIVNIHLPSTNGVRALTNCSYTPENLKMFPNNVRTTHFMPTSSQ